jgi:hypothetical protein
MLSKLPKATHLVCANAKIQIGAVWLPILCLLPLNSNIPRTGLIKLFFLTYPHRDPKIYHALYLLYDRWKSWRTKSFTWPKVPQLWKLNSRPWTQILLNPYTSHQLFSCICRIAYCPKRIIALVCFYHPIVWHKLYQ